MGFAEVKEIYYLLKLKDVVQNNPFTWQSQAGKKVVRGITSYMYMEEVGYTDSHCKVREKNWRNWNYFFVLFFPCRKKGGCHQHADLSCPDMLTDVCTYWNSNLTCAHAPKLHLHVHLYSVHVHRHMYSKVHLHVYKVSFQHFSKRSKMLCWLIWKDNIKYHTWKLIHKERKKLLPFLSFKIASYYHCNDFKLFKVQKRTGTQNQCLLFCKI